MNTEPTARIVLAWYNHKAYVANVEPQNETWARDNLLREETYSAEEAMQFPISVAEAIIARWGQPTNLATPKAFAEIIE